jgi:hypothetical protein
MKNRGSLASVSALFLLLTFSPSSGAWRNPLPSTAADGKGDSQSRSKVVYVCACLKTKSCSCMTEAKMEGPCACGTEGGPPLKPVPTDSDWAKQNREALAK